MNKQILLGMLIFALSATGISYLTAAKTSYYADATKIKTPTPSSDPDRTDKKILDRIKEPVKTTPRKAIRDEKDVKEIFTPPAPDTSNPSFKSSEGRREKLEKATRENREGSSEERTKTERIAEERKAVFIDDSKASAKEKAIHEKPEGSSEERTKIERIAEERKAVKSDTSVDTKTAKPLDSVTGAIVPYKGKSSELATTSSDEKKSGMSGKQKAAIGAAAVGTGVVGAGLIGAGLIGAGLIGVGLGGDKDKPAEGIAPEKVEDIKGLDVGSGTSALFEPTPISD